MKIEKNRPHLFHLPSANILMIVYPSKKYEVCMEQSCIFVTGGEGLVSSYKYLRPYFIANL